MSENPQQAAKPVQNKKVSVPSPIMIIAVILVLSAIATYIVPAGEFVRIKDAASGRMIVDPNSFHFIAQKPTKILDFLMSIPKGIKGAASIVGFLMIIGGALNVMAETGAIHAFMGHVVKKMEGHETLIIPVLLPIFICLSATAGCSEEYIAFIPLMTAVCYALGFDSIVAAGMFLCAVGAGYGAGVTNPFTVGVAQSISGLPMFSGIQIRLVMLVTLIIVTVIPLYLYARMVKKHPEKSFMYDYDQIYKEKMNIESIMGETGTMTRTHKLVLFGFCLVVAGILIGVLKFDFYMDEIAALFIALIIYTGIVSRMNANKVANAFIKGVAGMALPCMMVGMCKGVTILLDNGHILDTIIYYLANSLNAVPKSMLGIGMFIVQDIFNMVVPSGSGQAAITMPIMAPLADLVGITRQTAVLAFQMGDAFTNSVTPASGTTMTILSIAGIPLRRWWEFAIPMLGIWWIVAFVVLFYATAVQIGPF